MILTGSPAGFGSSSTDDKSKKSSFFCCTNDSTVKQSDITFRRKDKLVMKTPIEVNQEFKRLQNQRLNESSDIRHEKVQVFQKKDTPEEVEPSFFTAGVIQKFFKLSRLAICLDDQISEQLHEKYKWICMKYD